MAAKNDAGIIVGHIPRMISAVCSLFLHRGGTIVCEVTGSRSASVDLPQGGMKMPCMLKFAGEKKFIDKVKKLLTPSPCPESTGPAKATHTDNDKQPSDVAITVGDEETASDKNTLQSDWLSVNRITLFDEDCRIIATGKELHDKHISFAQSLLKNQFKDIQGLRCMLLLASSTPGHLIVSNGLQIIHTQVVAQPSAALTKCWFLTLSTPM